MADHLPGEPEVAALLAKAASFLPGFAGAVLSLAFVETLSVRGRVVTVAVGICAAAFLAPAMADGADLIWPGVMPASVRSAIQFLVGLCAMGAIPPFLKAVAKYAGDPLSLLKVRIGSAQEGN